MTEPGCKTKEGLGERDITRMPHRVIDEPYLHVVLYRPEIPANTGNIARLCGAAELPLHLIHPLGFSVDNKHLKRAGLDYWQEVDVRHHESFSAFRQGVSRNARILGFSRHAGSSYASASVRRGDYLLFGQETRGLPADITSNISCYRIPIWGRVRSLNLSTSVGIAAYHCLHQLGRF